MARPDLVGLAVVEREDVVGEEAEGKETTFLRLNINFALLFLSDKMNFQFSTLFGCDHIHPFTNGWRMSYV